MNHRSFGLVGLLAATSLVLAACEGGAGELTGYDVEVANAVAEKLGVKAKFEETQWDCIFAGLEAKRFDAIANQVTVNPHARKSVNSPPRTRFPGVSSSPWTATRISPLLKISRARPPRSP